MNKSIFRFITLLGIVVMVFGGAGSMAAQSGSYPWDGAAVMEVGDADGLRTLLSMGGTDNISIRLTGDITVDANIECSTNATIDLNGKALDFNNSNFSITVTGVCLNIFDGSNGSFVIKNLPDDGKVFIVSNGATLNFYDGQLNCNEKGTCVYNKGTVNVYGGTFDMLKMGIDNAGTLNIKDGTFTGDYSGTGVHSTGTVTVYGGTFDKLEMGIDNAGTLNIKGGTFKGILSETGVYNTGTVTVEGGTFEDVEKGIDNEGTLTIKGVTFTSGNNGTGVYNNGTATVEGGTFNHLGKFIDNEKTLYINGGVFTGEGCGTGVYNNGTVTVNGGDFKYLEKGIDNAKTLIIKGGLFFGVRMGAGVYNSGTADVYGGEFKQFEIGIYNAGTMNLHAIPDFGGADFPNLPADIGLAEGKVITMAGEISSLPADYVKIKVGQFSYTERNGDYTAGSAPYVVTSGYKDKVKGIHPAMMFQAYDPDPSDNEYYEFCAKSGSGTDVGEAQVVKIGEDAAAIFTDGNQGLTADLQICVDYFPENTPNAEIKLLRNVDLGSGYVDVFNGSADHPVVIDLNGHLLTGNSDGGVINVNGGAGLTIRDSGSGGTIIGHGRVVYNANGGTATISGGTFIGVTGGSSPIYNEGTMRLGCDAGAVTVLGGGGTSAVGNRGALTVGENVTITSGEAAGIYNPGTLTVAGFPTFDAGNACDIRLEQASNGSNTFISFTADISGGPANPIKIKIEDINGDPVTPGTSGLTLTSGFATYVKRGGWGADKDRPQEPGLLFTVLGVADGTYLLLSGGEAVAYAGSFPVAEVKSGDDTYTYNIGTGALGLSTAAGALVQAVYAADRVDDDTTVKMLCDVDLGTAWLDFRTFTSAVGYTPENAKKMTLDLNGFELSGCQIKVIDNSVYSLTVVNTGTDGGILQYGADGVCIANYGELTVKGVTLRATGVSGNRIYNFGTLTIDGEMKFLGSVDANDVYLAYGKTLGIGESLNLSAKLKVYVEDATNIPRKLSTGYGKTVRYEAGDANAGKVKAPGDVFTVTNIGGNKLAFAGGEAWVVPSGTLALIQTATAVNAYTNAATLYNDVETLTDDATVMLADDVDIISLCIQFLTAGKLFTLDLGGHTLIGSHTPLVIVEGGALLDIIDSGGSGLIKSPGDGFEIIRNDASTLSIVGALTIEHIGTNTKGIRLKGGTTTLKGWPAFNRGEDAGSNIYLENGALISFTDDISAAPAQKISVTYKGDNLGTLTSGYGAHVTYPAGHEKAGKPIDPDEIFTYKPYGSLVAKVHAKLEGSDDAAEAAFWMPHQMVAYIDAAGDLHDDLTDSTPETSDDGHDAYILDGTETTLGADGTDTWYVALPRVMSPSYVNLNYDNSIKLKGNVHLVLANNCHMAVVASASRGCIYGDASTSLTIYAQNEEFDIGMLSTSPLHHGASDIRAGAVTINGGDFYLQCNTSQDCYGIYADGGGLTFNGGEVRSLEKYGFYADECGITVNGGNIRALKEHDNGIGIYCQTTGAHTIDINGGTVSAEGDKAGIWATNDVNIKSDVTGHCRRQQPWLLWHLF